VLAEALEHLVRGVVDNPDDVTVRDKQRRRGSILEVRVHPDDLGKVIGRGGRTATACRTVVSAHAGRGGAPIDFVDVDPDGRPGPQQPPKDTPPDGHRYSVTKRLPIHPGGPPTPHRQSASSLEPRSTTRSSWGG
jgi:predicted RNA-binding protein YlqC (UPF0109 family)